MTSLFDSKELSSRIARERQAADRAKCENSKQSHLGLAEQYQRKLSLAEAVKASIRVSFG
jgi:hypothetical protein